MFTIILSTFRSVTVHVSFQINGFVFMYRSQVAISLSNKGVIVLLVLLFVLRLHMIIHMNYFWPYAQESDLAVFKGPY